MRTLDYRSIGYIDLALATSQGETLSVIGSSDGLCTARVALSKTALEVVEIDVVLCVH